MKLLNWFFSESPESKKWWGVSILLEIKLIVGLSVIDRRYRLPNLTFNVFSIKIFGF